MPLVRFDKSPIWRIHQDYFKNIGIKAWQRGHIPYSGVSNFTEAYKKARLFVSNLILIQPHGQILVLEVGAGFGEFAKNFLAAFKEICIVEKHDYYDRLSYHISDFSQTTLDELAQSGRLAEFEDVIEYRVFDALDKYAELEKGSYDLLMANYLLDQFPARVFAKKGDSYFEKYLSIEDPQAYMEKQQRKSFWLGRDRWIKRLKQKHEFREFDFDELPLDHADILETCFRPNKTSSLVYSYGSLAAIKNFLTLLKPSGLMVCSDFNASNKPGFDKCEPCYYGNSVAQGVNFEFLYKYFSQGYELDELKHLKTDDQVYQMALIYEDPVKPLHTLILTRPDYDYALDLGKIYKQVYHQNWLLRMLYKFLVEMQLAFYILALFMILFFFTGNFF